MSYEEYGKRMKKLREMGFYDKMHDYPNGVALIVDTPDEYTVSVYTDRDKLFDAYSNALYVRIYDQCGPTVQNRIETQTDVIDPDFGVMCAFRNKKGFKCSITVKQIEALDSA